MEASRLELIRFGYGVRGTSLLAPGMVEPDRVLAQLDAPDPAREALAGPGLAERIALHRKFREILAARREAGQPPGRIEEQKRLRAIQVGDMRNWVYEANVADCGFRERLVNFWVNRMTVAMKGGLLSFSIGSYRDDAIRPHVAGRFPDMVAASAWHPAMVLYLDQATSFGPNSEKSRNGRRGINENYARELMELHTMGGAGYTQADVTSLALLLTGMTVAPDTGTIYDPGRAEPGNKTVIGKTYGPGREAIEQAIEDISMKPETAHSISFALARHFITDTPPADLVEAMAADYLRSDGQLVPVYRRLLEHPEAANPILTKLRSPQEYMVASFRALDRTGTEPPERRGAPPGGFWVERVLAQMGQKPYAPIAPIGWPETAEGWSFAPGLATRLWFAEQLSSLYGQETDPIALAGQLLDGIGHPDTALAVSRAEQPWEGVAILLSSPDFMRR